MNVVRHEGFDQIEQERDYPIAIIDITYLQDLAMDRFWAVSFHKSVVRNGGIYVIPFNPYTKKGVEHDLNQAIFSQRELDGIPIYGSQTTTLLGILNFHFQENMFGEEYIDWTQRRTNESAAAHSRRVEEATKEVLKKSQDRRLEKRILTLEGQGVGSSLVANVGNELSREQDRSYVALSREGGLRDKLHHSINIFGPTDLPEEVAQEGIEDSRIIYGTNILKALRKTKPRDRSDMVYAVVKENLETKFGETNFVLGYFKAPLKPSYLFPKFEDDSIKLMPIRAIEDLDNATVKSGSLPELSTYSFFGTYIATDPQIVGGVMISNPITKPKIYRPIATASKKGQAVKGKLQLHLQRQEKEIVNTSNYRSGSKGRESGEMIFFDRGSNPLSKYRSQASEILAKEGIKFYES